MKYEVWILRKSWGPSGTKYFTSYKAAKKFAKILACNDDFLDVWIVGREDVKRESYEYL